MICQNCGNQIPNNSDFCGVCGAPVAGKTGYSPKNNTNPAIIGIIVFLSFVILILAIALVIIFDHDPAEENPMPSVEPTFVTTPEPTMEPTPAPTSTTQVVIVKPDPIPAPPNPPEIPENTSVVSTMFVANCDEWISLRSQPSTSASRIATIPYGMAVGYIEPASNGFYKISYNGKIGYALSQYLSNYEPSQKKATTSPTYYRVVNCQEWISLRSTPSTSASKLAEIPLGATVQFISVASNGFYKVSYNGQVGYALASYLG